MSVIKNQSNQSRSIVKTQNKITEVKLMRPQYSSQSSMSYSQSRGIYRIPPRRPYLTTLEAITLLVIGSVGLIAFLLPLSAQYGSLQNTFHLIANSNQRPSSVPSSILDGLFAKRYSILGSALPAGLVSLVGLLCFVYALKQSSWRLTITNVKAQEWCQPIVDAMAISGIGLWLATFSRVVPHKMVPWIYIIALNTIFWATPIIARIAAADKHSEAWTYSQHKIPYGIILLIVEFWFLNHLDVSLGTMIAIIIISIPVGIFLTFLSMLIWIIKTGMTGEWNDYHLPFEGRRR
jgi:hypothetical protein